ncbi:MAG TPA: CerR family C-terminal domain-containing protein, partial [Candidatus Acidoferrales bacterium]|nr:CerR family C-terminal domain-containing protein [Candidatus Acidoferrales bacterium]
EEHFAAQGIAGARTDQIAAAAHANKAMLYYYFGDKRRLHRAVLENLFRQLRAGVHARPGKTGSPRENLRSFIVGYFDFLATHPNYPRLVHREAMEKTRNFDWIVREYLRPFYKQLTGTIERGVASGELRRVNPNHAAFTIVGMITSYFAAAPILGEIAGRNLLSPNAIEERKKAVLDFIDHGLMPAGARSR